MAIEQVSKRKSNVHEIYDKIKDVIPEEQVKSWRPEECPFCKVTIGRNSSSEIEECLAGETEETEDCDEWGLKCFCGAVYSKRGSKNKETHCSIDRFSCKFYNNTSLCK